MKTYIKPQTEIIEASMDLHLMAGSEIIIIDDKGGLVAPEQSLAPVFTGIEDDIIEVI